MTPIKLLFLALFFLTPVILFAQDIESDRPDKTDSPNTLDKGKFQIETGIEYSLHKFDNISVYGLDTSYNLNLRIKTLTAPTTLFRYGLLKNVELRLGFDFDRQTLSSDNNVEFGNSGSLSLNPPTIGAKVFISKGEGIIPDFGVIGTVKLPKIGDEDKQVKYFVPELTLAFTNEINNKLSVGYNLGVAWSDDLEDKDFSYSASLGYSITPKLGSFAEIFGNIPKSGGVSDQNLDAGLTYLVKKNIVIDVYGGLGLSEESNNFFIGSGISIVLN
ncbi:MAG: transporter [Bacteroidetes bacterium]|nr:transporter [Bacteroidota bacterium]